MIAFAVLQGPLPKLGVIAVALLAGAVIVGREPARRAWAMLGALVLAPTLLLADIWHSPQLSIVHRHPLEAAIGAAVLVALVIALAALLVRRPRLVAPLAVAALPFRIPISAGGNAANLLVPLYFVVAAACLAWLARVFWGSRSGGGLAVATPGARGRRDDAGSASRQPFEKLLAAFVVLYAVQAVYSADFTTALQNMVFFYVPFALLLALLRELRWDRVLLARCLGVTVVLALLFACFGFVEYATKTLYLNSHLIAENGVQQYFTVNSVFLDPNIFGRYLALVMILVTAVVIYDRRLHLQIGGCLVLAVLWAGLVLTLSRSSLAALLVGLGVLAAARWKLWPVLATAGAVIVIGLVALAISPKTFGLNQGLNGASSGRANLVTGGVHMFAQRPLYGYGSGAFVTQYRREYRKISTVLAASHTIPITVAAEQGLIGELVYLALVVSVLVTLFRGIRASPARVAIAAAFLGLLLHTMLYADFLEDPETWALLAIGAALAGQQAASGARVRPRRTRAPVAPAIR